MSSVLKTILLVGSPNSGKTTLYNWLTGSKFKTVNYPGATVEYSVGELQSHLQQKANLSFQIVDTPGIYSLNPKSHDEEITLQLLEQKNKQSYNAVFVVVDATQLNRQLLLAKQLVKSDVPVVVVLTMTDLLQKEGKTIAVNNIKEFLGDVPVFEFDGLLGKGLLEIIKTVEVISTDVAQFKPQKLTEHDRINELCMITDFLKKKAFAIEPTEQMKMTMKIDRYLLHPFLGYVFFFIFMTLFFASIYWISSPIMDFVDGQLSHTADVVKELVPNIVGEFLGDGLIKAVAGVLVFVPQIFILFLGIGLFESTGYLSRVAALVDGPLKKIGLGGRSFVPLLSGFACAVPALMATRNITSKKEKFLAQMVIPFLTCSARLPVYGLMIGFLFHDQSVFKAGLVMALLYFGSLVVGSIASAVLARLIKSEKQSRLMMDLPYYRRPRLKVLLTQSFDKSKSFVKRAGPVIATLAIVIWFATNFPKVNGEVDVDQTYAMKTAQMIEPVFRPMGLDGRAGFALLTSFAAREVFVASLALSLHSEGNAEEDTSSLLQKMQEAKLPDGSPLFTISSVVGILLFFMIALQCLSTVGVLKKETGGWKFALLQLFGSNLLAYSLAVVVVQSLKYFGL